VTRRVRQDLSALLGSIGRPAVSTCVSWGSAALAYPLSRKGGYAGGVGAAIICSLSVFFLAYLLGSGTLAFVVDAKRSCLPGSQRLARRADLLASILLLPALVLAVAALAGNPAWPAWATPVLVLGTALSGVLASRRPLFALGLFLLVVLTACWSASGQGDHGRGKEWLFALVAAALVLIPAAVTLLAAVDWRGVIRRTPPPSLASHSPWWASTRPHSRERQPAARIVRTCLGGMFVRLSWQLIIGGLLLALFMAAATGSPSLGASSRLWLVSILGLAAAGVVATAFLTQLSRLPREQIAELALMPGLGSPATQRRALYRAVLTPPLLWLGVVLLFGSADLLLEGESLSSVGMLAVCLIVLWLTYAIYALQKLASLPRKRGSFISDLMLLYLVVYASGNYYWVYTTHPQFDHWLWFWITPVLLSIGIAGAIGFTVRRLAAAPHPFLS